MIVDTLLVVAGPRACGKTRFIASCRRNAALTRVAPDLAALFERRPRSIRMNQVDKHEDKTYELSILHVDIYSPFEYAPILPGAELKKWMTAERFGAHDATGVIHRARELFVVTLHVPREVTLRRWLDRKSRDGRKQVATNLARVLSDVSDDDLLYEHLYDVWIDFIRTARPKRHWRAVENKGGFVIEDITKS